MALLRVVDRELSRITIPALITHGRRDRTVDVASAPHILATIASTDKRLIWFERSGHAITVDLEHDALFKTVLDWLNAH
jgi:carboxylesterase